MVGKPLLFDIFCGGGGAGMGYERAGFRVVGVDNRYQKNYPFQFIQMDAIEFLRLYGKKADVIHCSPPCQTHSRLNRIKKIETSTRVRYSDKIEETRFWLKRIGKPYIIENVEGADLLDPVMLCGSQFGLKVYRHRYFESNIFLFQPPHSPHDDNTPPAGRGVSRKGFVSITSGGISNLPEGWTPAAYKNMAMGIDWMTQQELTEAIPPAYTEYLGKQLLLNYAVKEE